MPSRYHNCRTASNAESKNENRGGVFPSRVKVRRHRGRRPARVAKDHRVRDVTRSAAFRLRVSHGRVEEIDSPLVNEKGRRDSGRAKHDGGRSPHHHRIRNLTTRFAATVFALGVGTVTVTVVVVVTVLVAPTLVVEPVPVLTVNRYIGLVIGRAEHDEGVADEHDVCVHVNRHEYDPSGRARPGEQSTTFCELYVAAQPPS